MPKRGRDGTLSFSLAFWSACAAPSLSTVNWQAKVMQTILSAFYLSQAGLPASRRFRVTFQFLRKLRRNVGDDHGIAAFVPQLQDVTDTMNLGN
jgi:hypothetical protein